MTLRQFDLLDSPPIAQLASDEATAPLLQLLQLVIAGDVQACTSATPKPLSQIASLLGDHESVVCAILGFLPTIKNTLWQGTIGRSTEEKRMTTSDWWVHISTTGVE